MLSKLCKFIKSSDMDDLLNIYKFGVPKRQGTIFDLRKNKFSIKQMVFFLSTGRCGTTWFTKLLENNKNMAVLHNPKPNLHVQGKIVYDVIKKHNNNPSKELQVLMQEIFLAGREEMLRYIYKADKIYIETNNHITFFARILAKMFPQARFVHLYRHPGEFVRSGLRRNYYGKNDMMIEKRIIPVSSDPFYSEWNNFTQLEKISWLWYETNNFIEIFKSSIPDSRIFNFNFNDLTVENISKLFFNIGLSVKEKEIFKMLSHKVNKQNSGIVKPHKNWSDEDKEKLKSICNNLSKNYGYEI